MPLLPWKQEEGCFEFRRLDHLFQTFCCKIRCCNNDSPLSWLVWFKALKTRLTRAVHSKISTFLLPQSTKGGNLKAFSGNYNGKWNVELHKSFKPPSDFLLLCSAEKSQRDWNDNRVSKWWLLCDASGENPTGKSQNDELNLKRIRLNQIRSSWGQHIFILLTRTWQDDAFGNQRSLRSVIHPSETRPRVSFDFTGSSSWIFWTSWMRLEEMWLFWILCVERKPRARH